MTLHGRLHKLEALMGANRTAADDFELSRPELLTVIGGLMCHVPPEMERFRNILKRHEANCRRKHGAYTQLSICDIFTAAHDGEEFCDVDLILARAGACGL